MKQTILSHLLIIPIIVATSSMLGGCAKESAGLFDSSPSERQSVAQVKLLEALTEGDGSWIMEYTPSEQQDFGAFVLKLNFNKKEKSQPVQHYSRTTNRAIPTSPKASTKLTHSTGQYSTSPPITK